MKSTIDNPCAPPSGTMKKYKIENVMLAQP